MDSQNNQCKLCLQEKVLRLSHIIPKSYFRKIKKNQQFYIKIRGDVLEKEKGQREFKELLLCKECEGKIQRYETYVANVLYSFKKFYQKTGDSIRVFNVNYAKFKLFQLSILWRGSITTFTDFESGQLNQTIEEDLRQMIFSENPGSEYDYPCRVFALTLENKIQPEFLMNPGYMESPLGKIIYYTFGGFRYFFLLPALDIPKDKFLISIHENDELEFRLIEMNKFSDIDSMMRNTIIRNKGT